tara:strand:+ start:787 stop:2754 length:1968 start_codon:yes stop_codon:yes gene_type:complete
MKINYRPEIDGLRAIAVLSVILYHLQLSFSGKHIFTGGFIGVDIFFVISGYLITSIILKEIFETKNFSFLYFYERRIRRIIPVLFFIIFVSIPFAWNYLLPSNLESLSKSIISSIFFVSNIFFHETGLIYGTEESILKPFLHTWSLSIEEQFYIFFPITVFLIFRFFKRFLLQLLILITLISFLFSQFISQDYISFNFYSLTSRIWELLAGSILAFFELKKINQLKNKNLKSVMTFLGLILISLSIFFFHDEMPHPSIYTLIPVLGVCLIIWFGNQEYLLSENILSSKILVNIGLISYSLYLWHYPILSFDLLGQFLFFNNNNIYSKTLYLLLIFTLSFFTYNFIEKKLRNKETKFKKVLIFIIFLFSIIISFNLFFIIKNENFAKKFIINEKIKIDRSFYVKESRKFEFENINLRYIDNENKKNVLIVGNSHGEDLYKIIYYNKNLSNKYDFEMISPSGKRTSDINYQVGCLKNLILNKNTNCKMRKRPIDNWGENILKQYERSHYILLSTKWYESDLRDLDQIIKLIKEDQKIPLIFLNNLESDIDVNELNIFDNFLFVHRKMPSQNELEVIKEEFFNSKKNTENINQKILKIAKENDVKIFDHLDYKCSKKNKNCEVLTSENFKIYWDYAHITKAGAIYFGEKIDKINFLDF